MASYQAFDIEYAADKVGPTRTDLPETVDFKAKDDSEALMVAIDKVAKETKTNVVGLSVRSIEA